MRCSSSSGPRHDEEADEPEVEFPGGDDVAEPSFAPDGLVAEPLDAVWFLTRTLFGDASMLLTTMALFKLMSTSSDFEGLTAWAASSTTTD
jgi:hypothetical protein